LNDAESIAQLAARNGHTDHAVASIAAGETISQFRNRLMIAGAAQPLELGMSRREIGMYNIGRALSTAMDGSAPLSNQSFEAEIHSQLVRQFDRKPAPHEILLPLDVIRHYASMNLKTRADIAATPSLGGFLVETENLGFVGLSLPRSVLGLLGVQRLEGLIGNVNIPVAKTAGAQSDLPTETTQTTEVDQTFGQIAISPHTAAVYTEFSRLLMRQTSPSVQAFLVGQILAAFAARLEFLLLQGKGSGAQPAGIPNIAGVGSIIGTSLALSGVLGLQTAISDRLDASGAYLTTQATAALLAARQKANGTSSFLWEGGIYSGVMGGCPAFTTSNMPAGKLLFGSWDYALLASWGTLSIQTNPFANFQAGIIGMRILHDIDIAALDPSAFAAATVT
jgi:HK97 family phage major capsid protein